MNQIRIMPPDNAAKRRQGLPIAGPCCAACERRYAMPFKDFVQFPAARKASDDRPMTAFLKRHRQPRHAPRQPAGLQVGRQNQRA
ncbi:MAG: hypothetical protein HBSAPP02_02790 [Phycisphaerae bacterium]|nr:MAG: hypothetical protein HBSAPP02_02790 [Phycisphaerae bacterium]